jgi:tellurite resistance protein TehA-like permease
MTNESYLNVSYFAAVILGLILAVMTWFILYRPHKEATTAAKIEKLGSLLRRVFPSWLILAVLLAFISVSYFDCDHTDYEQIVADRDHLVGKTQEQVYTMLISLAVALFSYCFVLVLFLWVRAKTYASTCRT